MANISIKEISVELGISKHCFRYYWTRSTITKPTLRYKKHNTGLYDKTEMMAWYKAARDETRAQNQTINVAFDNNLAVKFITAPKTEELTMASLANKHARKFGKTKIIHCIERDETTLLNRPMTKTAGEYLIHLG